MRQNISSSRWTRIVHTLYTQPKPKATYIKIWFRIYSEDFVPLKYSEYHQKLKEVTIYSGIPLWLGGRESTCCCRRHRFHPWVRTVPWRRAWQPTAVFLPENPMDRGAWWATARGVKKSWTRLSNCACTHRRPKSALQIYGRLSHGYSFPQMELFYIQALKAELKLMGRRQI